MSGDNAFQHFDFADNLAIVVGDAIVLDNFYSIKAVSGPLLEFLGFEQWELAGNCISFLLGDDFKNKVVATDCVLGAQEVTILKKGGPRASCQGSWFRSSFFGCPQDLTIIRIRDVLPVEIANEKLREKSEQLDALMYCAWHNLRGPIATIKGVMNLVSIRKDNEEIEFYFSAIRSQIEKLDAQLKMLISQVNNRL